MDNNRIEGIGHQFKQALKEGLEKVIGDTKRAAHRAAKRVIGDARNVTNDADATLLVSERSNVMRWFQHDIPFIAMLLLALLGLVFRLQISYWLFLMPVFGIISIVEGWRHFLIRSERLVLVFSIAAIWCALLLAIYLLYNSGVQGVLNANATSLAMVILLALGTFVAGVQARVWQICAVGGLLFLAVPGLGWLDQSPLLLAAITCLIIALGGLAWWFIDRPRS